MTGCDTDQVPPHSPLARAMDLPAHPTRRTLPMDDGNDSTGVNARQVPQFPDTIEQAFQSTTAQFRQEL